MNQPTKHFLAEIEESIIKFWQKDDTFEKSLANREGKPVFVFYDGPPFANGIPHYGHLEQTTIKDTVTRYKTMQGYYVPRRIGWDTHGLPIEYAIEKEHGFKSKKDIVSYGIDKFNKECRESVFIYRDIWEKMFKRVGRWADYSKTYATFDDDYIESVWWVLKKIYDDGLVYKDFRSLPYCPRCATPLSNFELNQGYQDNIKDPSLFVKFKIVDQDAYLLGWTTTPWSLPGNAAIAVNPEADYVYAKVEDEAFEDNNATLVLARDRLSELDSKTYTIVKEVPGRDLVGLRYEPLFKLSNLDKYDNRGNLYKVWPASFVSIEEGSGVLHVAPAFGEDDLSLSKQHNFPLLLTVDENGHVVNDPALPKSIVGKFFKQADNPIIEELTKSQHVFAAGHILHTYPFCWRCDTPLLYYATDSWMVKVTALKDRLIANNKLINWVPTYIRDGRFGKWIEQARDWSISRNRFWGAPLPIWVTDDGEVTVIGSIAELKKMAVDPKKVTDLHRPNIDDVVIKTTNGKLAHRIPEVFDVWFESGSMPYGQIHYPFNPESTGSEQFPADFIAEAVDQTRGWFYTLHVLAVALFDKPAFENVICSGWIVAADGEKLSKRKKNYAPMDEVFDQYGVDTLRYFISSSPLMNGEDTRFSVDLLRDVQRKIFMTLLNTFNFYKMYAEVDNWSPPDNFDEPTSDNTLDKWMVARVNQAVKQTTAALDAYRLDKATRPMTELIDDLSNWFVRRSRRRFWKGQDDQDKQQAYTVLHYALITTCQLLAPISPFLTDHMWHGLVTGTNLPGSVHLSDWPKSRPVNLSLIKQMAVVRELISEGLKQRAEAGIKVRQPLASARVTDPENNLSNNYLKQLIIEELNLKDIKVVSGSVKSSDMTIKLDTKLTKELEHEGYAKEVIRLAQAARKSAGLKVDDRIKLFIGSDDQEVNQSVGEFSELISSETLAVSLETVKKVQASFQTEAKLEGSTITIGITKV